MEGENYNRSKITNTPVQYYGILECFEHTLDRVCQKRESKCFRTPFAATPSHIAYALKIAVM